MKILLLLSLSLVSFRVSADELRSSYGPYFQDETKKILICSYQNDPQDLVVQVRLKTKVLQWSDWDEPRVEKIQQSYTAKIFFLDKTDFEGKEALRISQYTYFSDSDDKEKDVKEKIHLLGRKFRQEEEISKMFFVQNHDFKISSAGIEMRDSCGMECSKVILIDQKASGDLARFCPKEPEGF